MKSLLFYIVLILLFVSNYYLYFVSISTSGEVDLTELPLTFVGSSVAFSILLSVAYSKAKPNHGMPLFWLFWTLVIPYFVADYSRHGHGRGFVNYTVERWVPKYEARKASVHTYDWTDRINGIPSPTAPSPSPSPQTGVRR